jgi:hypothetical protein
MGVSFMVSVGTALPPLPCRASPPQGGRSARRPRIASFAAFESGVRDRLDSISPLEGEMPGRAEGGIPCENFAVPCPEPATPC